MGGVLDGQLVVLLLGSTESYGGEGLEKAEK